MTVGRLVLRGSVIPLGLRLELEATRHPQNLAAKDSLDREHRAEAGRTDFPSADCETIPSDAARPTEHP
jgi:hypothetical protein